MNEKERGFRFFYARLALTNLKSNKSTYIPYILACIGTVFTYFLLSALAGNKGMEHIPASESLMALFRMGVWVTAIFSILFILYANSFLMKRRKKEIGLYSILGLEKRHISFVLFYEMLFMSIIGIAFGLLLGAAFGKLCFLILLHAVSAAPGSEFLISSEVVGGVVLFFGILFFITFIINYIQVKTNNPIALLTGEKAGEKEPKASILLTLIGTLGIAFGYYMALESNSVMQSIPTFFIAVICVIIGTYATFTSGSIAVLKRLKKSKAYYYKANHFIAVSNMLYRMKKNAAGLASICIISTMILVVLSTTLALFDGRDELARMSAPHDLSLRIREGKGEEEKIIKALSQTAEKHHVKIDWLAEYYEANTSAMLEEDVFGKIYNLYDSENPQLVYNMRFIPQSDYTRISGEETELKENEVLLYCKTGEYKKEDITVFGKELVIREQIDASSLFGEKKEEGVISEFYFIVKDKAVAASFLEEKEGEGSYVVCAEFSGLRESKIALAGEVKKVLKEKCGIEPKNIQVESYEVKVDTWNSMYGGLLFLGIILGILFIMAMVLIIYFKQVSEGYEDRIRFEVMEKVGMSKEEIKTAINKQVQMVFFLPVAGAVVHLAFAFRIIQNLLLLFGFANTRALLFSVVIVVLLFSVLYYYVYMMTKRAYRQIISRKEI